MNTATAFIGVGYSAVDRHSDRSILSYAHEAALDALRAAGIERDQIDGYVGIDSNPNPSAPGGGADGADRVSAYLMVDSLGLGPLSWVSDVSGFAVTMAATAAAALQSGLCTAVLGVRAVRHDAGGPVGGGRDGGRADAGRPVGPRADTLAAGEDQWTRPFGAGPGGTRFGLRMRQYLERSGARREDVWPIVSAAREHARNNPVAYFRDRGLSLEEYLAAPMISDPLSLYDCDLPVSGAGAFVMVPARTAQQEGRPAAYLRAHANWTNADGILERAGLVPGDIDVCQLYDGYSFMVYEWLERLGWCDRDAGWKFVADGHTRPGGDLPVNTFGGALGEGRLHGIGHLREGISQVMGTAGPRQVSNVEHCLVQIGPYDRSALAVLSREC